jgi:hypothetical protein
MKPKRRVKRKYVVNPSKGGRDYKERQARRVNRRLGEEDSGHGASVNPFTGVFLKSRNHPTVQKELDWYNSPQGADFRREYELKKTNSLGRPRKFFKYKKRKDAK